MDPWTGDDVLNRKSLSLMYRDYKKDTEYIAGWLAWTSKQCGYVRAVTESESQPEAAKQTPKLETRAEYPKRISEFVKMARLIASCDPKIEVPAALQKVFDPVISARSKMASWFEKVHSGNHRSNKRHSYLITILKVAAALLKPLIPEAPTISENIRLQNRFSRLTVEETDPLDDSIVEIKEKQLPKIDPLPIEQDEEGLEEDFFAIATFLTEIYSVRSYVTRAWDEYRQTGEGLTRTTLQHSR